MPTHDSIISNVPIPGHHGSQLPEVPEEKSVSSHSWLTPIRSVISWFSELLSHQKTPKEIVSGRVIVHSSPNLVQRAREAVERMESSKHAFVRSGGAQAEAFADRYIEPVFERAKQLIERVEKGEPLHTPEGAARSLEILALANDPDRLYTKIFDSIVQKTTNAILEDMMFLMSYPSEAIEDSLVDSHDRAPLLRQIEQSLVPVLRELELLISHSPTSDDFHALFQWRQDLDMRRQQLHDAGMRIIDDAIHRRSPLWRSAEREVLPFEDPFLEELEIFTSGSATWPLSIFELEEVAERFREAVENELVAAQNERALEFFDRIKSHTEKLANSEESEGHEAALNRIIEDVHVIELLLRRAV
jgi:hypothetical protein